MNELHILQPRTCGECSLCCKLLHVRELDKPAGEWCMHRAQGEGCKAYATRPQSCKDFECMWLQEESMPDELRPDKSHVVLWVNETGEILLVSVDPEFPDAYRTGEMKKLLDVMHASVHDPKMGIIIGKHRFVYFPTNPMDEYVWS